MSIIHTISDLFTKAIKKSIIAVPFLLVVYLIYGIEREHGNRNVGSMYPFAFAIPGIIIAFFSYILFYVVDEFTKGGKINPIKNFAHLVLLVGLLWFSDEGPLAILTLSLTTILGINLIRSLSSYLARPSR